MKYQTRGDEAERINKELKDVFDRLPPGYGAYRLELPVKMYHYTTSNGLLDMLGHNRLRFGSICNFNDKDDGGYGLDVVNRYLSERDLPIKSIDVDYENIFCICTSGLLDDAAMWERYADGGKGYCVEIIRPPAEEWMRKSELEGKTQVSPWLDVIYGEQQAFRLLDNKYNAPTQYQNAPDEQYLRELLQLQAVAIISAYWKAEFEFRKIAVLDAADESKVVYRAYGNGIHRYLYMLRSAEVKKKRFLAQNPAAKPLRPLAAFLSDNLPETTAILQISLAAKNCLKSARSILSLGANLLEDESSIWTAKKP